MMQGPLRPEPRSAQRDRVQTVSRRQHTSAGRESQAGRMAGARRLRAK